MPPNEIVETPTETLIQIRVIDQGAGHRDVACGGGQSLMRALQKAGVEVPAICDGSMSCGTCHVYVPSGLYQRLDAPSDGESGLLEFLPNTIDGVSRLSCQINVDERLFGASIELAPLE